MGSGFIKSDWYKMLQLRGTLVCLTGSKEHAARRKCFSNAFSQQNLLEWEDVIKGKVDTTIAEIKKSARENVAGEVDILMWFTTMASGIAGELCFGESFRAGDEKKESSNSHEPDQSALVNGIRTELAPGNPLTRSLPLYLRQYFVRIPILNKGTSPSHEYTPLRRHDFQSTSTNQKQTFLSKALAENESGTGLDDATIVREAKAFIVAGTDTTAVTATYLIWALLKHPAVNVRLQEEIMSLPKEFSTVDVQNLAYLRLVIQETLRLYGSVSGSLPRVVPSEGRQLGAYFIPENCIVTTQSFTLHRNPEIFVDPLR